MIWTLNPAVAAVVAYNALPPRARPPRRCRWKPVTPAGERRPKTG